MTWIPRFFCRGLKKAEIVLLESSQNNTGSSIIEVRLIDLTTIPVVITLIIYFNLGDELTGAQKCWTFLHISSSL